MYFFLLYLSEPDEDVTAESEPSENLLGKHSLYN